MKHPFPLLISALSCILGLLELRSAPEKCVKSVPGSCKEYLAVFLYSNVRVCVYHSFYNVGRSKWYLIFLFFSFSLNPKQVSDVVMMKILFWFMLLNFIMQIFILLLQDPDSQL